MHGSSFGRLGEDSLPILLGGVAGAILALFLMPDVALADDCLRYVRKVQNFAKIPKELLEDCMRTGIVQAAVTGGIGAMGGGLIAIAVADALKGMDKGAKPRPADPGSPTDYKPVWENETCVNCGAALPDVMPPGGRCAACGVANPVTNVGKCPRCGKFINLDTGDCVACGATFTPPDPEPPPEEGTGKPPTDYEPVWENDTCVSCGAALPDVMPPGGRCAACGVANPVTNVGKCPRCGQVINLDTGQCVACGATFEAPERKPPPENPPGLKPKGPETVFDSETCRQCGAKLPAGPTSDGRCAMCGARNPTTAVGPCPKCGKIINLDYGDCPACGTPITPPPKPGDTPASGSRTDPAGPAQRDDTPAPSSAPPGTSSTSTPSTGSTSSGSSAAPDPVYNSQGVVSGDKAADLLEEAGLAKVTRDASGKPIRIEEAYPGAFTNLGGNEVTLKTSESSGGGKGPDWVEEAKGKIAGIGFKPTADGGIGEPVVVVNHGDSKWREQPAPAGSSATPVSATSTPPPTAGATSTAPPTPATAPPSSGLSPAAEANLAEIRSRLEQIDTARAAYNIAKAGLPREVALRAAEDLARDLGMDPKDARAVLEMDDRAWAERKFWAINSQNPAL